MFFATALQSCLLLAFYFCPFVVSKTFDELLSNGTNEEAWFYGPYGDDILLLFKHDGDPYALFYTVGYEMFAEDIPTITSSSDQIISGKNYSGEQIILNFKDDSLNTMTVYFSPTESSANQLSFDMIQLTDASVISCLTNEEFDDCKTSLADAGLLRTRDPVQISTTSTSTRTSTTPTSTRTSATLTPTSTSTESQFQTTSQPTPASSASWTTPQIFYNPDSQMAAIFVSGSLHKRDNMPSINVYQVTIRIGDSLYSGSVNAPLYMGRNYTIQNIAFQLSEEFSSITVF